MKLKIKSTVALSKAHSTDAGWDIIATDNTVVRNFTVGVPTGLYLEIPDGWCGIVKERSGNALNKNIRIHGGVIDSEYRGEVKVLMSSGQGAQLISKGDKIAQILFVPVPEVEWEVVESVDNDTSRGEGGFGSSDESAV
jgi:dUTP pyrophosphatase